MGVLASQAPPAKRYKSSCGRTLRSKPARSRPDFNTGAAGGAGAAGTASGFWFEVAQAPKANEHTAAAAVRANRWNMEYPGKSLMGRSIKKAPGFWGSGLEKADFR